MSYNRLDHALEMLRALADRMRKTPGRADEQAREMTKLLGDSAMAESIAKQSRSYWFELNHPDYLRELEAIIATFSSPKQRARARKLARVPR